MPNASTESSPISSETSSGLPDGILLVDKPAGPTSHDVVAVVRRALQTRRVGHAGTLDPFATGLLVVLVGRATRLARFLVGLPKAYTGTIRLGTTTTTDDDTGKPLTTSDAWESLTEPVIRDAMASLLGRTAQRPPRFSAKSVGGRRAYRRARRGEDFELAPQWVEIDRFDLVARDGPNLDIRTAVASGVYVRAIARDLGERLGCGAHLVSLRRISVGTFTLADAFTLDQVVAGAAALRPASDGVGHLARREIDESERAAVRQGRSIPAPAGEPGPVALLSGGDLVAVAQFDGAVLRPSVVLEGS